MTIPARNGVIGGTGISERSRGSGHMKTYDNLLIGMRWVKPSSTQRYVIKSPATGEVVGETAEAAVADVDTAVAEARKAFDTGPWPRMSLAERLGVMTAARDYLAARTDELDTLATQENGISVAVEPARRRSPFWTSILAQRSNTRSKRIATAYSAATVRSCASRSASWPRSRHGTAPCCSQWQSSRRPSQPAAPWC